MFTKTKICKFHLLGVCEKGDTCKFAHAKEELNSLPDLSRTKLCKTLISTGSCEDPECLYAHNRQELRAILGGGDRSGIAAYALDVNTSTPEAQGVRQQQQPQQQQRQQQQQLQQQQQQQGLQMPTPPVQLAPPPQGHLGQPALQMLQQANQPHMLSQPQIPLQVHMQPQQMQQQMTHQMPQQMQQQQLNPQQMTQQALMQVQQQVQQQLQQMQQQIQQMQNMQQQHQVPLGQDQVQQQLQQQQQQMLQVLQQIQAQQQFAQPLAFPMMACMPDQQGSRQQVPKPLDEQVAQQDLYHQLQQQHPPYQQMQSNLEAQPQGGQVPMPAVQVHMLPQMCAAQPLGGPSTAMLGLPTEAPARWDQGQHQQEPPHQQQLQWQRQQQHQQQRQQQHLQPQQQQQSLSSRQHQRIREDEEDVLNPRARVSSFWSDVSTEATLQPFKEERARRIDNRFKGRLISDASTAADSPACAETDGSAAEADVDGWLGRGEMRSRLRPIQTADGRLDILG